MFYLSLTVRRAARIQADRRAALDGASFPCYPKFVGRGASLGAIKIKSRNQVGAPAGPTSPLPTTSLPRARARSSALVRATLRKVDASSVSTEAWASGSSVSPLAPAAAMNAPAVIFRSESAPTTARNRDHRLIAGARPLAAHCATFPSPYVGVLQERHDAETSLRRLHIPQPRGTRS